MSAEPVKLEILRTAIPMKGFEHASAQREMAEAIVARIEYDDGRVGWGETLPRDYVTGETLETVPRDIERIIWPACLQQKLLVESDEARDIPAMDGARCINAAATAVDIAAMRRIIDDPHDPRPELITSLAGRARLRNYIDTRVSGVLGSSEPKKTARRLALMRLYGLTDFKLKLGLGEDIDKENLRIVHRKLRKGIEREECTLRVDINGAWDVDSTPERVAALAEYGVCVVEQPVYCPAWDFARLASKCSLPLMADESLLTETDARTLLTGPDGELRTWWNIRISKNGGLLPALRLMLLAQKMDVPFTLGCMVGESSILSAAQRRLLQLGPVPRFVEGNYGRFLLADDLLEKRKSLRFGYAGNLPTIKKKGLGIEVDPAKIEKYGTLAATLTA
jgi:muconate cycloisomerase